MLWIGSCEIVIIPVVLQKYELRTVSAASQMFLPLKKFRAVVAVCLCLAFGLFRITDVEGSDSVEMPSLEIRFSNNTGNDTANNAENNIRNNNNTQNDIGILPPGTGTVVEVRLGSFEQLSERVRTELTRAFILNVSMRRAEKSIVFEENIPITLNEGFSGMPIFFQTPNEEGIYEIHASLQKRPDWLSGSRLAISGGPLQKRTTKTVVEVSRQCLILNAATVERPVGDWFETVEKELLETVEKGKPTLWQRLTHVPSLPKIGNMTTNITANLTTPKMPEMPWFGVFRERPSSGNQTAEASKKSKLDLSTFGFSPFVVSLFEQWIANGPGAYGTEQTDSEPKTELDHLQQKGFTCLKASKGKPQGSWEAWPLPVREPEKLHLLEIEYPKSSPQSLGVKILELLNQDGEAFPYMTLDSGIHQSKELVPNTPNGDADTATLRLLFWPKTCQPMLMLSNPDSHRDARFGDVRLYRLKTENVSPNSSANTAELLFPKPFSGTPSRLVLSYHARPGFVPMSNDWSQLHEACSRFPILEHRRGYDGAVINIASADRILFPSQILQNLPFSSDTGPLALNSPALSTQKDVVELLARLFDREQLLLFPSIDFDMPLPKVEEMIRQNPQITSEAILLPTNRPDFDGNFVDGNPANTEKWRQKNDSHHVSYNLLCPIVQDAMLEFVREIVLRYAGHPSFGGINVQLNPKGYAQLSDPLSGLDDRTFERFWLEYCEETGTNPTSEFLGVGNRTAMQNPRRFSERILLIQKNPKVAEAWIRWRTTQVRNFYRRMAETVSTVKPNARILIAGGSMLDDPDIRDFCVPTLSRRTNLYHALRMLGFDPVLMTETSDMIFLRPDRIPTLFESEFASAYSDFSTPEIGNLFLNDNSTAVLFHREDTGNFVANFAQKQSRRRFVKQISQSDVSLFIDGGEKTSGGEEEYLYDILAAFRQLPNVPFRTFISSELKKTDRTNTVVEKSLQPLTVRYANTAQGTFVYLVNDAPFEIDAELVFQAVPATTLQEISGRRTIRPMMHHDTLGFLQVRLEPYDLLAIRLNDNRASIRNVEVHRPVSICGTEGLLKKQVDELGRRIQTARLGMTWNKLENPDFELSNENSTEPTGWITNGSPIFSVQRDTATKYSGNGSLRITQKTTQGLSNSTPDLGRISSSVFESPRTGRLFVAAYVGIPESATQLPLNVCLNATHHGKPWSRSFPTEATLLPLLKKTASNGGVRWHRMVVPFDRLPNDRLDDMQIAFEMTGPGTVWIDEIVLYQIAFAKEEINELLRLVSVADLRASLDRVSDLLTILESHWPQYLFEHVPIQHVPEDRPAVMLTADNVSMPTPIHAQPVQAYTSRHMKDSEPSGKTEPKKNSNEKSGVFDRIKSWFIRE